MCSTKLMNEALENFGPKSYLGSRPGSIGIAGTTWLLSHGILSRECGVEERLVKRGGCWEVKLKEERM